MAPACPLVHPDGFRCARRGRAAGRGGASPNRRIGRRGGGHRRRFGLRNHCKRDQHDLGSFRRPRPPTPGSCITVPRRALHKATPRRPQRPPQARSSCRTKVARHCSRSPASAQMRPKLAWHLPNFGQHWPTMTNTWHLSTNFGQTSPDVGRFGSTFRRMWPLLTKIWQVPGQLWSNLGRFRSNS